MNNSFCGPKEFKVDDSILECKICYEKYDTDKSKPMMLGCGHTFCLSCIQKLDPKT